MSELRTSRSICLENSLRRLNEEDEAHEATPVLDGKIIDKSYATAIEGEATWRALCHTPNDASFTNVQVVKVVYDVKLNKFYFLKTKRWLFHYEFAKRVLGCKLKLNVFNVVMYEHENRDYVLGSLTHYMDQNVYTVELWAGDNLSGGRIVDFYNEIAKRVFFSDLLRFRALSDTQIKHTKDLSRSKLPTITSTDLFGRVKYQPLVYGQTYGYLHVFLGRASTYDFKAVRSDWVVLCEQVPIDLPPVAALITGSLQTPLAHVALLCQNRKTPNMAVRDIHLDSEILKLQGILVKVDVTRKGWKLRKAKAIDSAKQWLASKQSKSLLEDVGIVTLSSLREKDKPSLLVGVKAASLIEISKYELQTLSEFVIDNGLAVPFYYYNAHFTQHCSELLQKLVHKDVDINAFSEICGEIEARIKGKPFSNASFIRDLVAYFKAWNESGVLDHADGVIFRSSTNVEDLPNFNGAGLYLSLPLFKEKIFDKKEIGNIIKQVWASVWSARGVMERKLFGIDQSQVQAAVLVQPYFRAKVIANGVAITENPFRSDFPAHYINVQVAGMLVTDSCNGETPEQILVYDEGKPVPEVVSRSSVTKGEPILVLVDIVKLWIGLKILHKLFLKNDEGDHNCVDVEFLVLDNEKREIVVLQCRPLKLVRS